MKPFRLIPILTLLAASLLAVACNATRATPAPVVTASLFPSTPSPLPLSPTASPPPSTATPTPKPTAATSTCDPAKDFCIEPGHFLLERPIALPGTITIDPTYPYGSTQNGERQPHHGVEFPNASGTAVLAAADGVVVIAGNDKGSSSYSPWLNFYGNLIVIEHNLPGVSQPVFTLYGHLSKIEVQSGQSVHAGEKIGEVGATGAAIGSHLHFEVRLGGNDYDSNRNPVLWLKPLSGEDGNPFGVIAGRLADGNGNPIHYTGFNIQYFPDPSLPQAAAYQLETYAPEEQPVRGNDAWQENFVLGDLPAGQYRISFIWENVLYERWIEVQPGKVTVVGFTVE